MTTSGYGDDEFDFVIPGGGWMSTWTPNEDESLAWDEPVVAWGIHKQGFGEPLFTDRDGLLDRDESSRMTVVLWHPSATGPMSRQGRKEPTITTVAGGDVGGWGGDSPAANIPQSGHK